MEWCWQFIESIKKLILEKFDLGQPDFYGGVFSWLLIGVISFLAIWTYRRIIFLQQQVVHIPRALRAYKMHLEQATFIIRHSWKLEGQDFGQMLVPVSFEIKGSSNRLGIGNFINQYFNNGQNPRFVLTGEPGSGKSVAMGSIARQIWYSGRNPTLVPVLLTFSEIKNVRTNEEMETVVIKSLQKYQFEKGKRTKRALHYTQSHLYNGQMLLLLDGFDELEKGVRIKTATFLEEYFGTYPQIPFIISCRSAVWKDSPGVFATLHPRTISMVRFNTNDIRQFLSSWQFQGNKSSDLLAELIQTKPYLKTIAENPLMLTIIAYLYAQPKRILPDNRVKFYQECVDALMEEFDNTKQIERANEFQTIDKVTILSHIAYKQIVDAETTDAEISKELVFDTIKTVMEKLSRPSEKRQKMLMEIIQNTELLVELPPDHYKFPHRTFMEYFAANYFIEENKAVELLEMYKNDTGKWQETLALFCGMNLNEDTAQTCLNVLEDNFIKTKDSSRANLFVFRILVESAKVRPQWALSLLDHAKQFLKSNFDYEMVEYLGYISSNPNLTYSSDATLILTEKLGNDLTNPEITALLIALLGNREGSTREFIAKYIDNIEPPVLYELIKYDARSVTIAIQQFNSIKLTAFFEKIKENEDINMLLNIIKYAAQKEIKFTCALAIAKLSTKSSFYKTLSHSTDFPLNKDEERTYDLFKDWSWGNYLPLSINGKKLFALIIHYLLWGYKNKGTQFLSYEDDEKLISNLMKFHFITALSNQGLLNRYDSLTLINIPHKQLQLVWEDRIVNGYYQPFFFMAFAGFFFSQLLISESNYGNILVGLSILGLIVAYFIGRKDLKNLNRLQRNRIFSIPFTFILHFGVIGIFSKNIINIFFGLLFSSINICYLFQLDISNFGKTIYMLSYFILVFTYNIVNTGLLHKIILPFQFTDLLKDQSIRQ